MSETREIQIPILLDGLRTAAKRDEVAQFMQSVNARLHDDSEFRALLADEIRSLLMTTNSTHLLTEAGILSAESIGSGVLRRVGQRIAPAPPDPSSLEASLRSTMRPGDAKLLCNLPEADLTEMLETLWDETNRWEDPRQIASAAVILATRIAGAGLDHRLTERMPELESWTSPFIQLSRTVDRFASLLAEDQPHEESAKQALDALQDCLAQTHYFRAEKHRIGTTLHLSSASLRIVQQLERLRLLIETTIPELRLEASTALLKDLLLSFTRRHRTLRFINQKVELLAYLAIGHAAQKGEKYTVDSREEYWGFGKKSLFGGIIVAVFAILKIHLSHEGIAPVPQAVLYGFNYAAAFVLIYVFGATLATKQPALTASRIAKSLEEGPEFESFASLVRSIFQSQFMSFIGNILGAASFGLLLAFAFNAAVGTPLVSPEEATMLGKKLHLLESGTIFYAAIAGVMLSTAGFVAGFVDNIVVFHRLADRVLAGSGVFRLIPGRLRPLAAKRLEKHTGGLSGNIILGLMLGSAGSLGVIFGVPFDIRHIAFSSTHGALFLAYAPAVMTPQMVVIIVASVLAIGTVNFLVSFSLTLSVAIYARDLDGIDWQGQLRSVWQLARKQPLRFVFPVRDRGLPTG